MNNVMTPSGASTAVTGAPGVMVPPCDTLDWVNIATKNYHANGLVSKVRKQRRSARWPCAPVSVGEVCAGTSLASVYRHGAGPGRSTMLSIYADETNWYSKSFVTFPGAPPTGELARTTSSMFSGRKNATPCTS